MADPKTSKTDKPADDAPAPALETPRFQTPADEQESALKIALLQEENAALKLKVAALEANESSRRDAEAAAKAAKAGEADRAKKTAIAMVSILGAGRREVRPGEPLTDGEIAGLAEGLHYQLL